jgi:hypothetical protein
VFVCVLGCLCVEELSVCRVVVCVGWLSVCWVVVNVLGGCLCVGWLSVR